MAARLDLLNHFVEVLGNDQASANEEIVDPRLNGKFNEPGRFDRVHLIGIDQYRERLPPVSFFNQ
jgi:hypothetical protein